MKISERERKRLDAIQKRDDYQKKIIERQQRVLELFTCSDDNRIRIISETLGIAPDTASTIINNYYGGKIVFEPPNHKIYNSSVNYLNDSQQWKK